MIAAHGVEAEPSDALTTVYVAKYQRQILSEFTSLLSIPNDATHDGEPGRNAQFIANALSARGFKVKIIADSLNAAPAVTGELIVPGATKTALFYAHYDGQPVTQPDWKSSPFTPVIGKISADGSTEPVDWKRAPAIDPELRVFARSASDDKVAIQAMLTAIDALHARGDRPSVNLKVFYEGEEEVGSPHLAEILERHPKAVAGDIFILGDGPRNQDGAMQLVFGARGFLTLDITTFGPDRPLHDGQYGNGAPNPAAALVNLLAAMRADDGRVLIPGFYDSVSPVTSADREEISKLPRVEPALRSELGLGRTEVDPSLPLAVLAPALNIRGIRAGDIGPKAANVIAAQASASIDFRLAPGQTPDQVRLDTEAFFRQTGWTLIGHEPTLAEKRRYPKLIRLAWGHGYPAYRTSMSSPIARKISQIIEGATHRSTYSYPMTGGSVPIALFAQYTSAPIIVVGLANYDNNQHAANENLKLGNLIAGIEIYARLLKELGEP